jgi:hypothetical protein
MAMATATLMERVNMGMDNDEPDAFEGREGERKNSKPTEITVT